jgi:ABC-type xylose transport system permease subunit
MEGHTMETTLPVTGEMLIQIQVGTIAAMAALVETLIKADAVKAADVMANLRSISASTIGGDLGPLGQGMIDGVIALVARLERRADDSPARPN